MQVKLKLFSSLMEYLPTNADGNSVSLDVTEEVSCHSLFDQLKIPREIIQVVMVNGEFVAVDARENPLIDGDNISVWPAIQGG